jgi:hypothetical protein
MMASYRSQLVSFPKAATVRQLSVILDDGSLFYTHTVRAGETDFIVKVPQDKPCAVVLLENSKPVAGANVGTVVLDNIELELPHAEPAPKTDPAPKEVKPSAA